MTVLFFILSIQIASNEPVLIEAHPDCNLQETSAAQYETATGLICINPDAAFRDLISKQGFESE